MKENKYFERYWEIKCSFFTYFFYFCICVCDECICLRSVGYCVLLDQHSGNVYGLEEHRFILAVNKFLADVVQFNSLICGTVLFFYAIVCVICNLEKMKKKKVLKQMIVVAVTLMFYSKDIRYSIYEQRLEARFRTFVKQWSTIAWSIWH